MDETDIIDAELMAYMDRLHAIVKAGDLEDTTALDGDD